MRIFDYEDNFQTFITQNLEENIMWMVDRHTGAFTMSVNTDGILNALAFVNHNIKAFLDNPESEQEDGISFVFNGRHYTLRFVYPMYQIQYNGRA